MSNITDPFILLYLINFLFLDTYTCKFDEIRQFQEFINSFVKRFTLKVEKAELLRFESVQEKRTCILR